MTYVGRGVRQLLLLCRLIILYSVRPSLRRAKTQDSHPITPVPYDQVSFLEIPLSISTVEPSGGNQRIQAALSQDLKSGCLSLDSLEDDGILVLTDLKPSSIQIGSGSVLYH